MESTLFEEPTAEKKLFQALRAYVEEWGSENVGISLPKSWEKFGRGIVVGGTMGAGKIRTRFETDSEIILHAGQSEHHIQYQVKIAKPI